MRKTIAWLLLTACLAALLTGASAEEENLLENPDFEVLDENGLPAGWYTETYQRDGRSSFSVSDAARSGQYSASIRSRDLNDARFCQSVSVKPETVYCLSGWILAEGVTTDSRYIWGANFSIAGLADARSGAIVDTGGEWTYVTLYGETGPGQDEVTVWLRLGGYSGEADGFALFDDLCLAEAEDIPDDVIPALWFDMDSVSYDNLYGDEPDEEPGFPGMETWEEEEEGKPFWPLAVLLSLAYLAAGGFFLRFQRRETNPALRPKLPARRKRISEWQQNTDRWQAAGWRPIEDCRQIADWLRNVNWPRTAEMLLATAVTPALLVLAAFSGSDPLWFTVADPVWLRIALCLLAPVPAFWYTLRADRKEIRSGAFPLWLFPALLCAFAIRVIIAGAVRGYEVDVGCFTAWGSHLTDVSPVDFYQGTFCDYPPGYMLVLGLGNMIARLSGGSDAAQVMLVKLPPMLADIAIAALVAREAVRAGKSGRYAGLLAVMIAFNPVLIINSAAWCQVDSVLALLILLIAVQAIHGRWRVLMPTFMLAVLVKPQALMLGFLGLTALVIEWIRNPKARKEMLIGAGWALLLAVVILAPFTVNQPVTWIFDKYAETLSSYSYVTVNTANEYYLFGLNWAPLTGTVTAWPALLLAGFSVLWHRLVLHLDRKYGHRTAWFEHVLIDLFTVFFVVCGLFRLSWAVLGYGAMAFAFAAVLPLWLRSRRMSDLPLCGALLFLLMYVLGVKMHERYLFPAVSLLGLATALRRDRKQTLLFLILSCTVFINIAIPLDNALRFGKENGHLLTAAYAYLGDGVDTHPLACVLAVVNMGALVLAIVTAVKQCDTQEVHPIWAPRHYDSLPDPAVSKPGGGLRWKWADTVIVFTVTALYSALALTGLGSTKAPQSFWTSTARNESVVFDLGEFREDYTMLYYCGVSSNDFTVQVSEDGLYWSEAYDADMDEGLCYRWLYFGGGSTYESAAKLSGRYVRINANQYGLKLGEVIFRETAYEEKTATDEDGETWTYTVAVSGNRIPATVCAHAGGDPEDPAWSEGDAALDEQDTLEGEPSWFNGTYFDEIYHARTAYEYLNGQAIYEWTHPPLGKLLMALCISVFGMTPFGWRFAGAMTGILMLPVIYLLAKRLTRRTLPAAAAVIMMALDCMHYTQTRIATIDSFPVLFILLSYYFMLGFMQTDLAAPGGRTFRLAALKLALSGFFIGCAIASKWIGLYAGAGLAVMYFWIVGRHLLLASRVRKRLTDPELQEEPGERERFIAFGLRRRLVWLTVCCVIFFAVIPVGIYLLCYVPHFAWKEIDGFGDFLRNVWDQQISMYNYHKTPGLGMDHPYYSPWYEWPVIGKPMYYASASYVPEGMSYSIFCMGNPAVWWTGLLGVAFAVGAWLLRHRYRVGISLDTWHLRASDRSVAYPFVLIALLAQYLPWVLVPRGTYIYHYFASVPFLILCVALLLNAVSGKNRLAGWAAFGGYLLIVLALFILLFPYASGFTVSYEWLDLGKKILPNVYYTRFN